MSERLLILGASARAAAFSARRAGFQPLAADLFADTDLAAACGAVRVERFPDGLADAAQSLPSAPWMYTGALENHPDLIDRIAATRPLWGNAGAVVAAARDPWQLAAALRGAGLPSLEVRPASARGARAAAGQAAWLEKPLRSAGGRGIRPLAPNPSPAAVRRTHGSQPRYWQQYVEGDPHSAVFAAAAGKAVLLGVTRQLIGTPWCGARGFLYAGSLGPLTLADAHRDAWQQIGNCLAARFRLSGLFGVDAVVEDDRIWTVEINPRYTASVEVLERGLSFAALRWQAAACRDEDLPAAPAAVESPCGKAIVFARREVTVSDEFVAAVQRAGTGAAWPDIADVPRAGLTIARGRPVTTVLAAGRTAAEVEAALRQRALHVQELLGC